MRVCAWACACTISITSPCVGFPDTRFRFRPCNTFHELMRCAISTKCKLGQLFLEVILSSRHTNDWKGRRESDRTLAIAKKSKSKSREKFANCLTHSWQVAFVPLQTNHLNSLPFHFLTHLNCTTTRTSALLSACARVILSEKDRNRKVCETVFVSACTVTCETNNANNTHTSYAYSLDWLLPLTRTTCATTINRKPQQHKCD